VAGQSITEQTIAKQTITEQTTMNDQGAAATLESSRSRLDELEGFLQAHLGGRIRNLTLSQHEAGVILHGQARTFHAKQLAQHALMHVSDLPILANEIEVA